MPSKANAWLSAFLTRSREGAGDLPLDVERAQAVQSAAMAPGVPGVVEEPVEGLPGALLFTPESIREDVVILMIHGGGFRVGVPESVRTLAGHLAVRTGARVLCPKYRLAPEHPYPAGLDDCEAAYLHLRALAPRARVVVAGESAGGNLAAALLLRRRTAADPALLAGLLICGVYDLRPEHRDRPDGSWIGNAGTDVILAPRLGRAMQLDYVGPGRADDPGISPVLSDLAGLPPLLLFVSAAEMLLDDTLAFAAAAGRAGVETVLEIWPGMPHCWPVMAGLLPEGVEAATRAADFIIRIAEGRHVDGAALADDPDVLAMLPAVL